MIGSFRRAMGCNGTSGGQRSVASQLRRVGYHPFRDKLQI